MHRRDEGSVLLLAVGGVLLALAVVIVLADTSGMYLRRSVLTQVADEAALVAAASADTGPDGAAARSTACEQAAAVLRGADARLLHDVRLDACALVAGTVTLRASAAVQPLLSAPGREQGARIVVEAHARPRW